MLEHTAGVRLRYVRMAVHQYVGQVTQQLGAWSCLARTWKKVRVLFDETYGHFPGFEHRMRDHILQELDVGLHATDAEFRQGPVQTLPVPFSVRPFGRDFHGMESKKGDTFTPW